MDLNTTINFYISMCDSFHHDSYILFSLGFGRSEMELRHADIKTAG